MALSLLSSDDVVINGLGTWSNLNDVMSNSSLFGQCITQVFDDYNNNFYATNNTELDQVGSSLNALLQLSQRQSGGNYADLGYDKATFPAANQNGDGLVSDILGNVVNALPSMIVNGVGHLATASGMALADKLKSKLNNGGKQNGGAAFFPGQPPSAQIGYGTKRLNNYDFS